ncbi:MAG: hypothetical protein JWN60_237 [Acidobacteria bacterium]|jgi:hypothetical protein|nr:hypothetical protein [Acidobacteriota bacterium]
MKPKRVVWKIVVGIVLILLFGNNIPMYMSGSTQANAALATNAIAIFGSMYLLYRGLYPSK